MKKVTRRSETYRVVNARLGVLYRKARLDNKLSMHALAELSHIGAATISDLENGKLIPHVDILLQLAFALGISLTDIFNPNIVREQSNIMNNINVSYRQQVVSLLTNMGLDTNNVLEVMDYISYRKMKQTLDKIS